MSSQTVSESAAPARVAAERKITMVEALAQTLDWALATDPDVFLLGEDIIDPTGGAFGITKGLSTRYGRERVRETPISEQAIIGASIGAAMLGAKPIAEIMIADFYAVCLDQVANHAAKLRYMSGGRTTVPMVVRGMLSGGLNFAAQHSQSVESWMIHTPGLKVAMPSNPADAKGILTAAIEDPDPVIIFEPVGLYGVPGLVPDGEHRVPLGKAAVVREGSDVTVVTYGSQVPVALGAAEQLAGDGISVEVVDLRWLVPWDEATVLESVRKTTRAVIAHQAVKRGGFGAELAAVLQEKLWGTLRAPVLRVAAANTPVPFATELERTHFPTQDGLVAAIRQSTSS
ncbi:MAG: acetoin:2,6-dichlorophenolindophenol oxidoreductase subunit beta [Pseudonocardiales bacterium]|nr:acetoin:2,6-dichlorophenolindophenol oxidoreductase subunit beta [Pseudonocardiales bacterium]